MVKCGGSQACGQSSFEGLSPRRVARGCHLAIIIYLFFGFVFYMWSLMGLLSLSWGLGSFSHTSSGLHCLIGTQSWPSLSHCLELWILPSQQVPLVWAWAQTWGGLECCGVATTEGPAEGGGGRAASGQGMCMLWGTSFQGLLGVCTHLGHPGA